MILSELREKMRKAFTLAEILIVVGIIGIIAAIVLPEFQGHVQQAKEAAAKDNLRVLRNTIELYAVQHNGIPPGYADGDPANHASEAAFFNQLAVFNQYLREIPKNPFNGRRNIWVLQNTEEFPEEPIDNTDIFGWIYKPAAKTIKLYWPGTDSSGVAYYDY
jgi:prepilin-type N-terminal cleavage/methylation domain-containing protein